MDTTLSDLKAELQEVTQKLDSGTFWYSDEVKRYERRRLELKRQIQELEDKALIS